MLKAATMPNHGVSGSARTFGERRVVVEAQVDRAERGRGAQDRRGVEREAALRDLVAEDPEIPHVDAGITGRRAGRCGRGAVATARSGTSPARRTQAMQPWQGERRPSSLRLSDFKREAAENPARPVRRSKEPDWWSRDASAELRNEPKRLQLESVKRPRAQIVSRLRYGTSQKNGCRDKQSNPRNPGVFEDFAIPKTQERTEKTPMVSGFETRDHGVMYAIDTCWFL